MRISFFLMAFGLFLMSCGTEKRNEEKSMDCAGCQTYKNLCYFSNNIDAAVSCAAKNSKPILIHFTDWSTSNDSFNRKLINDPAVNRLLKTKVVLLQLYCDDRKKTTIRDYSLNLEALALKDSETVGRTNKALGSYLGVQKVNPQYILVNANLEPIGEPWGYIGDGREFFRKLRAAGL